MARQGKPRAALSPEAIESAALELIERDGIGRFSTRRLAAELGCEAMSIYHYYPSKAHLLDALLDRVVATMELPSSELRFDERIRAIALEFRAMAHRYPAFFQYMALHRMNTATALSFLDSVIGAFRDAGFDDEQAARLFRSFSYYVSGAALDETSGYAAGPSAAEPVADDVVARDYPSVAAVGPYFKRDHHERTFLTGLDILVDGIVARVPAAKRPDRRGRWPAG